MNIRDILVHVSADEQGQRRVMQVAELARTVGACLTGAHIRPPTEIAPLFKASQVKRATIELSSHLDQDLETARNSFAQAIEGYSIKTNWVEAKGDFAQGVSALACYADLVIIGQDEAQDPPEKHPLPVAHSVVVRCGRPVLVVPAETQKLIPSRAVIAWDGSREAVRAVHDALPLLRLAQAIDIVTIIRSPDRSDAAQVGCLITHLGHHGITARMSIEHSARFDEHRRLKLDTEHGYDLIVMGGYSHPRWLEFMIGGMTISTMLRSRTPVLLSH